jgi:hypothetical protein
MHSVASANALGSSISFLISGRGFYKTDASGRPYWPETRTSKPLIKSQSQRGPERNIDKKAQPFRSPLAFSSTMEGVCSAQVQAQNKHSGERGVKRNETCSGPGCFLSVASLRCTVSKSAPRHLGHFRSRLSLCLSEICIHPSLPGYIGPRSNIPPFSS